MKLELPYWYDLHTHLRQDELLGPLVQAQLDSACAGVLAMPNTKPPAAKIFKTDSLPYLSLEEYRENITAAGGDALQALITPLYLTKDTSPRMIEELAETHQYPACKYYPPHGTTGADFGYPFENFMENGVFEAMQDRGITLCIHGEQHSLKGAEYFDKNTSAEDVFYHQRLPKALDKFPNLKIACEHVTTKTAVDFVLGAPAHIKASVTPQHLLYTVGDLLQGCKYHLYCLPLLKFEEDRAAIRKALIDPANTKFYAGTDSAPHTQKATPCGCAAGCFTAHIAPQLYAQGFEEAGLDLSKPENQKTFENFLCHIGREFYDLPLPEQTFTLEKTPSKIDLLQTPSGSLTPLLGLGHSEIPWKLEL